MDANPSPRKQICVGDLPKEATPVTQRRSGGSLELDSLDFEDELIPPQGNLHQLEQEIANNAAVAAEMPPGEELTLAGNEKQLIDVTVNETIGGVEAAAGGETQEEPQMQQKTPDPRPLNQFKE